jgi:hypothetical protein
VGCYSGDVVKGVGLLGFVHLWTTPEGSRCFVHPHDPRQTELFVGPSITEAHVAKDLLVRAGKITGWHRPFEELAADRGWNRRNAEAGDIALRERELAVLERTMTTPPQGGNLHRGTGQARHWSGIRRR